MHHDKTHLSECRSRKQKKKGSNLDAVSDMLGEIYYDYNHDGSIFLHLFLSV